MRMTKSSHIKDILGVNMATPTLDAISFELLCYRKNNTSAPKFIIVSPHIAEKLFAEIYEFTMKNEGAKFENPINDVRQLFGLNLVVTRWVYGGSFNFAFGD